MIKNKIIEQQVIFESATGKKARNVYLGREDMKDLLKWAQLNGYIMDAGSANIEGLDRPVVRGLKCFEVNADRHIECA
jgi:predicted phosphatase